MTTEPSTSSLNVEQSKHHRQRKQRKICLFCWRALVKVSVAIRALLVRSMFVTFIFLAVWNVVMVRENDFYWLLLGFAIPFGIEVLHACKVIFIEKKDSSSIGKWFSPVVLLFLCSACPPIWIMKLSIWSVASQSQSQQHQLSATENSIGSSLLPPNLHPTSIHRSTTTTDKSNWVIITLTFKLDMDKYPKHPPLTTPPHLVYTTGASSKGLTEEIVFPKRPRYKRSIGEEGEYLRRTNRTLNSELFNKVEQVMRQVSDEDRIRIIEQSLLLCLIIARWLLPRPTGVSRQQLSQLLLVNIGMGADILELFEAFKEPEVKGNLSLTVAIMSLWQASLFQFCLTKTATKARKIRGGFSQSRLALTDSSIAIKSNQQGCLFCETELWAICTSVALQDGPFLILRILLIAHFHVSSYSNLFFTSKNTLIILLQLFRVSVILSEHRTESNREEHYDMNNTNDANNNPTLMIGRSVSQTTNLLNIPPVSGSTSSLTNCNDASNKIQRSQSHNPTVIYSIV